MVGLVVIYFIGKAYYTLAEEYKQSKWTYAVAGVAVYYLGSFLGGITWGIIFEIYEEGYIDTVDDLMLGLLSLPFGIATCLGSYKLLKQRWQRRQELLSELVEGFGEQETEEKEGY
ncbi:MAG: hypothetical protein ACFB0B_14735 [Thermonemataceae bacterium]